ncbi:MAG TPA: ribose-5-phosphate isomerase RpiA [Bryobacteraceae bacterium]|nr:ribose-5-phosphate isomerase RpiA [Bryobacteraceae bacterium]
MAARSEPNPSKLAAAEAAAALVRDGMTVGLGSGSTASLAVRALARRVSQGLRITGIPTSEKTAELARGLGIPLATLSDRGAISLTIDGADEVELGTLDLVKGLGGALLREKLVAAATERLVIVADESKLVVRLAANSRPLPVEVVAFAWQTTAKRLESLGAQTTLRLGEDGRPLVTDQGNYTLDCRFRSVPPARELQSRLDSTVGVVEHGLFLGMTSQVMVGGSWGVRVLGGER